MFQFRAGEGRVIKRLQGVAKAVNALEEEYSRLTDEELRAQDVRVDVSAHRAFQGEHELHLTTKEFELLRVLVANSGSVVVRDSLMREVWGSELVGSTKTLDMHVSWLRRKLGDDANAPRYISNRCWCRPIRPGISSTCSLPPS